MPFVALNTAAIPHDLLESELFGHERGAFTGAQSLRRGRFEQAEGGTLFLDEIGDMSLDLQTRLLRVLSDGNYYRVGGHQPLKANVRVIAATHQNLEQRVREGRFREDLFHRLNVIRLRLPPLRDRQDDIAELANFFLRKSAKSLGVEAKLLSSEALALMQSHPFPGNVRQLENLCHWLTVMAPSQRIEAQDLPPEIRQPDRQAGSAAVIEAGRESGVSQGSVAGLGPQGETLAAAVTSAPGAMSTPDWRLILKSELERALRNANKDDEAGEAAKMDRWEKDFETIVYGTALAFTRGRRIEAAQLLGVGRNTITRKIAELDLEPR
jgi:two-component system nitrogen regulation response regulator GlnG